MIAFRANLNVGDRFQWRRIWGGSFVGMVVKVEGTLAFVQFDNLTFAGHQTGSGSRKLHSAISC